MPTEVARHISELKLLAVLKAVIHFLPMIRGKVVMFHSDNSFAVLDLQNQGGHTLPMFQLTWDILLLCQQHGISL